MRRDPIEFLETELPKLFSRGMEALSEAAQRDASAGAREQDVRQAHGCLRLRIVSDTPTERWFEVDGGMLSVRTSRPENVKTRVAIAVERDVATWLVGEIEREVENVSPEWSVRAVSVLSGRAEKVVETEHFGFQLIIKRVPEIGEASFRIGIGREDPPDQPDFVATVAFESLEDFWAGKLTPQQLLMTKTRLVGDASRAVTVALQLMQPPR